MPLLCVHAVGWTPSSGWGSGRRNCVKETCIKCQATVNQKHCMKNSKSESVILIITCVSVHPQLPTLSLISSSLSSLLFCLPLSPPHTCTNAACLCPNFCVSMHIHLPTLPPISSTILLPLLPRVPSFLSPAHTCTNVMYVHTCLCPPLVLEGIGSNNSASDAQVGSHDCGLQL